MRPSVTRPDAETLVLQHAERRRHAVKFRHAVGLWALETHHGNHIAVEFARLESGVEFFLGMKDAGRSFDEMAVVRDRRGLDHGVSERAFQHIEAAGGLKRIFAAAQNRVVMGNRRWRPSTPTRHRG